MGAQMAVQDHVQQAHKICSIPQCASQYPAAAFALCTVPAQGHAVAVQKGLFFPYLNTLAL